MNRYVRLLIAVLSSLVITAGFLFAQTEPQKSAAPLASTTPPPNVHGADKTADHAPPMATPAEASSDSQQAKSQAEADKNAPPIDLGNFDQSVKPGDDFFTYSNGMWLKKNPIPADQSRWGSFNALIEKNNDALHDVAEKPGQAATSN